VVLDADHGRLGIVEDVDAWSKSDTESAVIADLVSTDCTQGGSRYDKLTWDGEIWECNRTRVAFHDKLSRDEGAGAVL
jgi:hypothetical protein